jgi:hypothetical protein
MKKSLLALAVAAALYGAGSRARTCDISISYRMGAGMIGDINRTHPFSAVPRLMDAANPIRLYGDPCLVGANNAMRAVLTSDQATATKIKGILVRPYPTSQTTGGMSATIGAATPPTSAVPIDILEDGHMMVKCNNFAANAPGMGGAVYVWAAASSGNHVLGGFEAAATAGSTFPVANAEWTSPADSNGVAEIRVWKA